MQGMPSSVSVWRLICAVAADVIDNYTESCVVIPIKRFSLDEIFIRQFGLFTRG